MSDVFKTDKKQCIKNYVHRNMANNNVFKTMSLETWPWGMYLKLFYQKIDQEQCICTVSTNGIIQWKYRSKFYKQSLINNNKSLES